MKVQDKNQLSNIYDTWIILVKSNTSDGYTIRFIGKETIAESDKLFTPAKAQQMKQRDCTDNKIRKEISFGVNDSKEKRESDKEKFKAGKYMELKSITFQHKDFDIDACNDEIAEMFGVCP